MQLSQAPGKLVLAFGADAGSSYIRTIPVPSQIPITPGAASYTDGFPPLTMTDVSAGGVAISGPDMNGILNEMSSVDVWSSAGGVFPYDATFSAAIGGYPKGAIVLQASGTALWMSTADNNTSDPDTGGANWEFLAPISLTTNGATGPATLSGGVLNIPNYTPSFQKQVFTTSGTFTIPAGITSVKWTIVGAGGGGGGLNGSGGGGGGAAGGTARKLASGYTPGNTITVTVGTGGAGGYGSGSGTGASGGVGGSSSISSGTQTIMTVTALGGGGGNAGGVAYIGGTGGGTSGGDSDSSNGGDGGTNIVDTSASGATGGASSMGGGGTGDRTQGAAPGVAWGSGGGGGGPTTGTGGAGANGIVIAEWIA